MLKHFHTGDITIIFSITKNNFNQYVRGFEFERGKEKHGIITRYNTPMTVNDVVDLIQLAKQHHAYN